jgi:hypothetical protein
MICGLAIDRFGLMVGESAGPTRGLPLDRISSWTSIGLVLLGVIMVITTGLRFLATPGCGGDDMSFRPITGPIWRRSSP